MTLGILLVSAYLAGSVNFAIIALKLLGKGDPRRFFSGNAGTTNVYRQAGKGWAVVVLLLDVGRGAVAASAAVALLPIALAPWVGVALVMGNRFPLFHQFQGGKGVASYLGTVLVLSPWGAAAACLLWVLVQRLAGYPFIASFAMVLALGAASTVTTGVALSPLAANCSTILLILLNHGKNIQAFRDERQNLSLQSERQETERAAGNREGGS
ncbi:MAG: glycerol-3-phosphate acyltransferase [Syntrophaceae bacterium]|nr:glycerol-3-phosphate acyltransferase [Syntrophaceae bacterium]